ncbi:UDP-N-acetylmuramoyl-tripeptide--D-alanyl-D-alanine ligase [Candidatus Margulisiibacteriota bacterium]
MAISIDSRTLRLEDVFIPVKGPNFDGHDFIEEARSKGAYVLDVDLAEYAAEQRREYSIPVIAVTGSSGKTMTKDSIAALLATKYKTLKTEENFNNEIGVPLTLLRLNAGYEKNGDGVTIQKGAYEAAVIELAMRGEGEIGYLTGLVRPTHVVITNIGLAHIGKLGSREKIKQAKCEVLLPTEYSRKAFLNRQDACFTEVKQLAEDNGWQVVPFDGDPLPQIAGEFGIDGSVLKDLKVDYSAKRMETINRNGLTIINDTYNANPDSVKWALDRLREMPGRKIAVLGDMLELGADELQYHKEIDLDGVEMVFTFGPVFAEASITGNSYTDKQELIAGLKSHLKAGDVVLVKGSRSMKMEEVVDDI